MSRRFLNPLIKGCQLRGNIATSIELWLVGYKKHFMLEP